MTEPFSTYRAAFNAACDMARSLGHDVGIEKVKPYGTKKGELFRIFSLPKPENRFGFEARCEVVTPTMPKMEK